MQNLDSGDFAAANGDGNEDRREDRGHADGPNCGFESVVAAVNALTL
jgi:hypothetical protein